MVFVFKEEKISKPATQVEIKKTYIYCGDIICHGEKTLPLVRELNNKKNAYNTHTTNNTLPSIAPTRIGMISCCRTATFGSCLLFLYRNAGTYNNPFSTSTPANSIGCQVKKISATPPIQLPVIQTRNIPNIVVVATDPKLKNRLSNTEARCPKMIRYIKKKINNIACITALFSI
jgi:hypothetical protein